MYFLLFGVELDIFSLFVCLESLDFSTEIGHVKVLEFVLLR